MAPGCLRKAGRSSRTNVPVGYAVRVILERPRHAVSCAIPRAFFWILAWAAPIQPQRLDRPVVRSEGPAAILVALLHRRRRGELHRAPLARALSRPSHASICRFARFIAPASVSRRYRAGLTRTTYACFDISCPRSEARRRCSGEVWQGSGGYLFRTQGRDRVE